MLQHSYWFRLGVYGLGLEDVEFKGLGLWDVGSRDLRESSRNDAWSRA